MKVTVKRQTLNTEYQPFSIVITGDFDYNKVEVADNTTSDYEDKPQSQRKSGLGTIMYYLTFLLFLCCPCLM